MASYTNQTKNTSTFTNQTTGRSGLVTWGNESDTWDQATYPWGNPAQPYTNQTKHTSIFTNQTKH